MQMVDVHARCFACNQIVNSAIPHDDLKSAGARIPPQSTTWMQGSIRIRASFSMRLAPSSSRKGPIYHSLQNLLCHFDPASANPQPDLRWLEVELQDVDLALHTESREGKTCVKEVDEFGGDMSPNLLD